MTTFLDVRNAAQKLLQQPYSFSKEDFLKVVEEYAQSLPDWLKNSIIGIQKEVNGVKVTKAVKRKDLPKVLREDEEFFNTFVRILANG